MIAALAHTSPFERVTLGDRVYAELRELLIGGELAPGEKLSLRAVADALGVSIMPVREAVSRLVADEALEVQPNRAVAVPLMTAAKFRELTRIRLVVEGFAVEEAARGRDDADLAALAGHDDAFRREARKVAPDAGAAVRANKDFHFSAYRASRLPSLVAIIEGLWLKIGPVLNLDMKRADGRLAGGDAEAHHGRLLLALAGRDGVAARAALTTDIESAAGFIAATGRLP